MALNLLEGYFYLMDHVEGHAFQPGIKFVQQKRYDYPKVRTLSVEWDYFGHVDMSRLG